ncbi:hypothetical protein [Candidatus Mycoplasma haematominutum]|uniref:Uncharacterized protein n=1 Tax=Candidatus Mycoplasma haematominutum 'Birmingham 1' TaxID=1116213 RepID=G8C2P6_9MOLU|nr:hypothetical protein [Candidatus Mycoplasma haematominutum]CCE66594.1 hypothetical protein MHM_00760 [Candidatus Mycoplasma haematominutum 'Birmingham 1']
MEIHRELKEGGGSQHSINMNLESREERMLTSTDLMLSTESIQPASTSVIMESKKKPLAPDLNFLTRSGSPIFIGKEGYSDKLEHLHIDAERLFLKNLQEILARTLWVDGVNSIPWIYEVKGIFPSRLFKDFSHYSAKKILSDSEVEVSVKFDQEVIQKLRDWGSKWSSTLTTPIRQGMEELFLRFISSSYTLDKKLFEEKQFIQEKVAKLSFDHFASNEGNYPTHTIRFIRDFQGKSYYLDIIFNSQPGENQLYIPHIYSDNHTYSANGSIDWAKDNLGVSSSWSNKLDRDFARMFTHIDIDPLNFYKQITVVGRCLEDYRNCGSLLSMAKARQINYDPVAQLHPFASIYGNISAEWDLAPPTFPSSLLFKKLKN